MGLLRRALLVVVCVASALIAQPALAAAHPLIGIADNNALFFRDPRFLALGITTVRDDVPWNVMGVRSGRAALAQWLASARADDLTPLITFDHGNSAATEHTLPSVAQYSRAFLAFRAAFPWVTEFVTWDEANFYAEPTAEDPRRAAQFYLALRHDCHSCTILAVDLLDVPRSEGFPLASWAREFIHYAHGQPAYWGINNYVGANRLETGSTKQLLAAVRGKIWFAETGGIVDRNNASKVGFPQNAKHAALVDRFILDKLARLSPRIQRVYFYDWNTVVRHANWDSAIISFNGVPRPSYDVLANTLDDWGVKPNCAISTVPPACSAGALPPASLFDRF